MQFFLDTRKIVAFERLPEQLLNFYKFKRIVKPNWTKKEGKYSVPISGYCQTQDKEQGTVERGFWFLKDKSFRVSEVYLKKESRIEALAMVMVLCLLLYSIAEWKLRTRLEEAKEAIRSQVKKKTQTPTMKWVFFQFRRIT